MPRWIVALAWLAALGALASPAWAAPAAPGFRVKTLEGRPIDSNELIGKKIVVLRFQASYCKPCAKEAAAYNRLVERYRSRGVEFIAIHVQDTVGDTRAFVRTHRISHPVVLDPRLNLGNRFGFKGTPYTVVIDRKGEIVIRLAGQGATRRLPQTLDGLLKESPMVRGDRPTGPRLDQGLSMTLMARSCLASKIA